MPHPLIPDASFPPGRNERCYCGSGKRFKHCCGGPDSGSRRPPFGVGVVENFLSPEECRQLVTLADALAGQRFTLPDGQGGRRPDDQRVTEWVDCRDGPQALLDDLIARAFARQIVPATGLTIQWYEQPQLLRYEPGGYYLHHSDAYQFVPEHEAWQKVVDRDISVLLYANEEFTGGQLEFKRLFYRLQPSAGMLVWFPSDVRYEHMALPVTSGRRYVIVSWAAVRGIERVQAQPAPGAIFWPHGD